MLEEWKERGRNRGGGRPGERQERVFGVMHTT